MTAHPGAAELRPRRATEADAALLLAWRNDPAVRAVSRTADPISADAHLAWLRQSLVLPDRHLLVLETEQGTPAATVRYDLRREGAPGRTSWEISITVAPALRGGGLGGRVLDTADAWLRTTEPEALEVVAHVRPGNTASHRMFERRGYRPVPSPEPGLDRRVKRWAAN